MATSMTNITCGIHDSSRPKPLHYIMLTTLFGPHVSLMVNLCTGLLNYRKCLISLIFFIHKGVVGDFFELQNVNDLSSDHLPIVLTFSNRTNITTRLKILRLYWRRNSKIYTHPYWSSSKCYQNPLRRRQSDTILMKFRMQFKRGCKLDVYGNQHVTQPIKQLSINGVKNSRS